ncbi:isoaspartyl peptidase/L-asparaginase family protein [uncultured Sphingomonas sp.]|uniref:isoaspartyl peptidase/L-asparaginase family protein n=1 Tax=uncultured Sphingomonas sp. TaxID=158754 RepID=UPI0035CB8E5E
MAWTLLIHGGCGIFDRKTISPATDVGVRAALNRALDAGAGVLAGAGSAVDAVEAAIRVLEDDSHFNAGRGAALTYDGIAELDAAIVDGRTRAAGAVAGTTRTRNPVALARAVMERSAHVFLAGVGADDFGAANDVEQVTDDWHVIPERRDQLAALKARGGAAFDTDMKYGTVGAVAVDASGHVAAATSTGGVTGKRWGRIGDSPIVGAGTWADDRACAVSCTGAGEYFIRTGFAHEIAARLRYTGAALDEAVDAAIAEMVALGGTGGAIVVAPGGEAVWRFSTPGMFRGRASASGERIVAIYGDEP